MYVAGFNRPGYLPESEPVEFSSFDAAKAYLIDEIKRAEDSAGEAGDEETAETLCGEAEDINLWSSPGTLFAADGYAYWITEYQGGEA